jgi:hypothetical protein
MAAPGGRDALIGQIARRQRGIVSRDQLRQAGISDSAINRLVARDRLHRVHPGVFAVGHDALQPLARETAALLSVGFDAVLCGFSAADLWQLLPPQSPAEPTVHVLLRGRHAHARPGIAIHRTTVLERRDVRMRHGLPVTSPARALLDVADRISGRRLERAVEEALARKLTRKAQIADVIARAPGRCGARRLAALLETAGTTYTRSGGEEAMLALIREAGLPEPLVNARLHGFEVDFYWPEHGLVLEVDGYDYHSSRFTFEHDRRKGAVLTAHGLRVMRATGAQVDEEPLATTVRVAQALAAGRWRADRPRT